MLNACGRPPSAPAQSASTVAPGELLSRIVERYWDERPRGIELSAQGLADSLAAERRYLAEVEAVPRAALDPEARLTYDIFLRRRREDIQGYTYPSELMPVEPFDSPPFALAREAAKAGEGQLSSARDYEHWIARMDEGARWMRQSILNMREGLRRGYTLPKVLVERTIAELVPLGVDTETNLFYAPMHTMPDTIKESERSALGARLGAAAKDRLLPAYRALREFLESEYLPKARTSPALSALPLGSSWYAYRVERATGTRLRPDEIHASGLAEVERIRTRLESLPAGGAPATGDPIARVEELKARVLAAAPGLFVSMPQQDFAIRAFRPRFAEPSMVYVPADPAARRSAVLFVNGTPPAGQSQASETVEFLEAGVPGRHLQSALQEERADLPRFRRFASDPGFVQGWALYAVALGEELNVYDEEGKRAAMVRQLECAIALVVDTGLHAQGWTRGQAVDYVRSQLAADDTDAGSRVDRYIASPGDALACKIGELKLRALRGAAQQALGGQFDAKEFHAQILKDGSMPLDILDAKISAWLGSRR
jgi:uncharacterized protein (DUF885 family)